MILPIAGWLTITNGIAFALMLFDKRQARHQGQRIAESTLIGWSLIGGSLGALAASVWVRHKTRKQPIAALLRLIPIAQATFLLILALWQGWIPLPHIP